jgi:peptide chain release factor 2
MDQIMHIEQKRKRLNDIEEEIGTTDWSNIKNFASLSKEKTSITNIIENFNTLKSDVENLNDILQLPEHDLDENILNECEKTAISLQKKIKQLRIKSIFTKNTDNCNAFLEINSGAGGTESNDWASMLLRMYLMWADNKKFKSEIIDKLDGEEAGIKSVVIQISGEYAYGLLKNETGTHRLVRISPFNANGKRQTSFAGVFCYPEVNENIDININPSDIRIDVYRSSGAGGQHVNKTESAVRITHIPTGIVASSQTQRSQLQNRENAMKMLKSKLYEVELKKQNDVKKAQEEAKSDISWGNQIRNYVLHPYKMVKDLRSGIEISNANAVLDGDLDDIIESVLQHNAKNTN